jgi:hypothetical protein
VAPTTPPPAPPGTGWSTPPSWSLQPLLGLMALPIVVSVIGGGISLI